MCVCVCWREEIYSGGTICTKASVPDYYGEQVATEDKARKKWRGRAADGVREEEQQRSDEPVFKDVLLLIHVGNLRRGVIVSMQQNRSSTKSGGDATTGGKV